MGFYISTRGALENCLFDSKKRAEQHAMDIAIARGIPRSDVLVIKADTQREAQNKSDRHFGH